MKKKIKRIIFIFIAAGILISLLVLGADRLITYQTEALIFNNTEKIPYNKAGLLLGTSKYLRNGYLNPYFTNRIKATSDLYKTGKIKYIVVSGDNSVAHYNEPEDMKNALVEAGVPDNVIFLDYAGFRTLDSVVRMKEIFGQQKFTVISQQFHNERAIYIARHHGIDAIGYNAKDVSKKIGIKVIIREYFARIKVFLDFLVGKEPKFLGEKIVIP